MDTAIDPTLEQGLDIAADTLDGTGRYRVLRRFRPRDSYGPVTEPKAALFVDVETTGLNVDEDKIIQFAGVRFSFDSEGHVGRIGPTYTALEDPGVPLPERITDITGITSEQLAGQRIDDSAIAQLLDGVVLVIAHNAEFDRKMIERRFRGFDELAWGCSQRDVKWERYGMYGAKLDYLVAMLCREFYDAHDALADCLAGVHLLATPRVDDRSPFQQLLETVRTPTFRLFAWNTPFATKDRLRLNGYRWLPAPMKVWAKDVKAAELEGERAWLVANVYDGHDHSTEKKISPFDRYSVRG